MKTCFFVGHRDATEEVRATLRAQIERHILQLDVKEYIVGQYGGFDRLVTQTVREIKYKDPRITLLLLVPYHPAERPASLPEGFDGVLYPPGMEKVPRRLAIVRANRYVLAHTDYLIAYVRYPASNSQKLLAYAQRREEKGLLTISRI